MRHREPPAGPRAHQAALTPESRAPLLDCDLRAPARAACIAAWMTPAGTVRSVPELISPTARLRDSWLASRDEWGRDVHQDGAGLRASDDVDSPAGFARWVGRLAGQADTSRPAGEGRVHASYWWITEDGTYLGAISIAAACRHHARDATRTLETLGLDPA